MATALPLFHLYGDPPDDQAFDFIHVETIASRSSIHDWTIRAHRHRNLFQILLIEQGGGEMTFEGGRGCRSRRPAAILVPRHGRGARISLSARTSPGAGCCSFTEDRRRPPRRPRRRGAVAFRALAVQADRSDCRGRGAVAPRLFVACPVAGKTASTIRFRRSTIVFHRADYPVPLLSKAGLCSKLQSSFSRTKHCLARRNSVLTAMRSRRSADRHRHRRRPPRGERRARHRQRDPGPADADRRGGCAQAGR